MNPRYSLKFLLIFVVATAAFCYWRTRPAAIANRFAVAIQANDFATAESLLASPERLDLWNSDELTRLSKAVFQYEQQSLDDWLQGCLTGRLLLEFRADNERSSTSANGFLRSSVTELRVTAAGIEDGGSRAESRHWTVDELLNWHNENLNEK